VREIAVDRLEWNRASVDHGGLRRIAAALRSSDS